MDKGHNPPSRCGLNKADGPAAQAAGRSWHVFAAALLATATTTLGLSPRPEKTPIRLTEAGSRVGIQATIVSGSPEKKVLLESNGSGLCWLDYDRDGWMDLLVVNGSTLEALRNPPPLDQRPRNYLYRNSHAGTFAEVGVQAGVAGNGWGTGCAAADYDNDGWTDLMIANFGPNQLLKNNGDGTFRDVAATAGVLGGTDWHTGVAFGDYDRDGNLDLYVAAYGNPLQMLGEPKQCDFRGAKVFCGPKGLGGAADTLFHNQGDGTFADVTRAAGVEEKLRLHGFTALFEDFNGDGWPDIFVANDMARNYLYINKADGTFEEEGELAGVAYPDEGREQANMGVAVGDYDRNGTMDIFVTTFADDHYTLFRNEGDGLFTDATSGAGLASSTYAFLGWGTFFADLDNDGWLELVTANGHVYPQVENITDYASHYRQKILLFQQTSPGHFGEVGENAGLEQLPMYSSRAAAYADYDNDGAVDLAYSNLDGPVTLLRNTTRAEGHWLTVQTVGTKSNHGGIGARVKILAGGVTQYQCVRAGENYISSNDPRIHFGLGKSVIIDLLEIAWPNGKVETVQNLPADRFIVVRENAGLVSSTEPFRMSDGRIGVP